MAYGIDKASSSYDKNVAKDDRASFVLNVIADSETEFNRLSLAHQEATLNAMGAGSDDFPVTPIHPYG